MDTGARPRQRWCPNTGATSDREGWWAAPGGARRRDDKQRNPRGGPRYPSLSRLRSQATPRTAGVGPSAAFSRRGLLGWPRLFGCFRVRELRGNSHVGGGDEDQTRGRQRRREPHDEHRREGRPSAGVGSPGRRSLSCRGNWHGLSGWVGSRSTEGLSTRTGRDLRAQGRDDVDRAQGYSPSTRQLYPFSVAVSAIRRRSGLSSVGAPDATV